MKERIRNVLHKNKEVLVIDYSNLKETAMIEIVLAAKEFIVKENKKVVILSIFNHKNYISPKFVRLLEKELREAQHLIAKNAVTGISEIQRWIVKGINLWYKTQVHPFDSIDNALEYLVS